VYGKNGECYVCSYCVNTQKKYKYEINRNVFYLGKYYVTITNINLVDNLYDNNNIIYSNLIDNCKNPNDIEFSKIWKEGYLKARRINPFTKYYKTNYLLCATINAVICIPENHDIYLTSLKSKYRNMIKKAEKSKYICGRITNWNSKLDDIYEINNSTDIRCNKKINNSLVIYPEKKKLYNGSEYHYDLCFGVWKNSKLVAYSNIKCNNDTAIITRFLGHKEHLTYGIMNLFVSELVKFFVNTYIKYFIYCEYDNSQSDTLLGFKKRTGFKPYLVYFKEL